MKQWFTSLSTPKQYGVVLGAGFFVLILVSIAAGGGSTSSTKTVTVGSERASASPETKTVTVTNTVTVNHTKTIKAAAPKPVPTPQPAASSGSSAATRTFAGNGGRKLKPFKVDEPANMTWTNDGAIFQVFDIDNGVTINSQAHKGENYIEAGTYTLDVNAIGNWMIRIEPA
jgi:hypothetical protein